MGTIHQDARQSTGDSSNVIRIPKPIVTADVAIGSISPVSRIRPPRRHATMASAASAPSATATTVATAAIRSDVSSASRGSTPTLIPGRISVRPRFRHADRL